MTKCKLLLLVVLLLMCGSTTLFSQQAFQSTSFTAIGNNGGIRLLSSGVGYNGAVWNKSGVVTLCSFKMDSSVDGSSWNNGDILGATDCSVNGSSAYTAGVYNYVRVRVTSFTGSGSVRINQLGYIVNPTPTSGFDCSATANTDILFNDSGNCGGDAGLTYDKTLNGVAVLGPNPHLTVTANDSAFAGTGHVSIGADAVAIVPATLNYGTSNISTFVFPLGLTNDGGHADSTAISLHTQVSTGAPSGGIYDFIRGLLVDSNSATLASGGSLTLNEGILINSQAGVGTTNYALHIADQGSGASDYAIKVEGGKSTFAPVSATTYSTGTNCANSGGTCGAAAAGAVTIAAAATTVTVATTAVTAASRIAIAENSSLGGALSVTCNTTFARIYAVTTITAGTSFVITSSAAPAANPACLTYSIVN